MIGLEVALLAVVLPVISLIVCKRQYDRGKKSVVDSLNSLRLIHEQTARLEAETEELEELAEKAAESADGLRYTLDFYRTDYARELCIYESHIQALQTALYSNPEEYNKTVAQQMDRLVEVLQRIYNKEWFRSNTELVVTNRGDT